MAEEFYKEHVADSSGTKLVPISAPAVVYLDNEPAKGSSNPVMSGGVYNALDKTMRIVSDAPLTFTQGIDFDGVGLPTLQEFCDKNISNRIFGADVTLVINTANAIDHLTIVNVMSSVWIPRLSINASAQVCDNLNLSDINMRVTFNNTSGNDSMIFCGRLALVNLLYDDADATSRINITANFSVGVNAQAYIRGIWNAGSVTNNADSGSLIIAGALNSAGTLWNNSKITVRNTGVLTYTTISSSGGIVWDGNPMMPEETFHRRVLTSVSTTRTTLIGLIGDIAKQLKNYQFVEMHVSGTIISSMTDRQLNMISNAACILKVQRFTTSGNVWLTTSAGGDSIQEFIGRFNNIDAATATWATDGALRKSDIAGITNDRNNPSTWAKNTQIDFGDGTFGYRSTGNIVAATNTGISNTFNTTGASNSGIVSFGGWWQRGDGTVKYDIGSAVFTDVGDRYAVSNYRLTTTTVGFTTWSPVARTGTSNNAFEFWMRYTK